MLYFFENDCVNEFCVVNLVGTTYLLPLVFILALYLAFFSFSCAARNCISGISSSPSQDREKGEKGREKVGESRFRSRR